MQELLVSRKNSLIDTPHDQNNVVVLATRLSPSLERRQSTVEVVHPPFQSNITSMKRIDGVKGDEKNSLQALEKLQENSVQDWEISPPVSRRPQPATAQVALKLSVPMLELSSSEQLSDLGPTTRTRHNSILHSIQAF